LIRELAALLFELYGFRNSYGSLADIRRYPPRFIFSGPLRP
jgi:hypothetical protein